jgi:hypothetical protein
MSACCHHKLDVDSIIQRWTTLGQQQLSTILWKEQ